MKTRQLGILITFVLVTLGFSPVHADSGGPDEFGYSFADSDEANGPLYDFEDIAATGDPLSLTDEEVSSARSIGFSFNFYGVDYTDVYIGSNGYISFLPDQESEYVPAAFPTSGNPDAIVAAWWSDLDPSAGGSIRTQTLGEEPNRRFIVQFTEVPTWTPPTGPDGIPYLVYFTTHQYKLFEGSNVIEVHYARVDENAGDNTAGIENETGTVGLWYADDIAIAPQSAVRYYVTSTAPDCTLASASIEQLWPPNHQFVPIEIEGVTDPDGDMVLITIDSIFQDEPVDTVGDGNTGPDGQGVGSSIAEVRAERTGTPEVPGNGRVYHIGFTATAGQGQCTGVVTVGVPHDQESGATIIDGGALYDSTL